VAELSEESAMSVVLFLTVLALPADDNPVVPEGAKLEKLWGEGEFTEGPAYGPDGCVYFSDIGNSIPASLNCAA
jgi:gluconolactonase